MLYRIDEVLELKRRLGIKEAAEKAYDIRLDEIAKSGRWPYRIAASLFGFLYFSILVLVGNLLPKRRVTKQTAAIIKDLAVRFSHIPEILIFKGIELEAACSRNYAGKGLDIGCGNGYTGAVLMQNAGRGELHGIDRSIYFDSWNSHKTFVAGDARNLPYANASFDFAVCLGVLDHIYEVERALSEIVRTLKPGGHLTFAIQTAHFRESTLWYRVYRALGLHVKANKFQDYRDVYDIIYHYRTEAEWRKVLADAGFAEVEVSYIFSDRNLMLYDLLNIQTYYLRFFFANHAMRMLARRPVLAKLIGRAAYRIAGRALKHRATPQNATRYFIRATKAS